MAQSIVNNAAVATAGRVLNVALGLVVVALITRYLGPASYGLYVLALSFGTIVQLVADAGLYLTFSRQLAEMPNRAASLLGVMASLRGVLLAVAFTIGAFVTLLLPSFNGLLIPFLLLALGLAGQSISQLYMAVFQYHQTVWRATVGDLLGRATQILGIISVGVFLPTLPAITAMFAAGSVVALLIHWMLSPVRHWKLPANPWRSWKSVLAVSWPLGALLLLNVIYFRVDTVILSLFRPAEEVAWYGLAYRIVESMLFFPAMLGGLLLPRMSESLAKHSQRTGAYLSQGVHLLLVVLGLVMATLLVESDAIVVFIAGASFSSSGPLLQLLAWALAIMFIGNMFGFALVALGRQQLLLRLYALLAVVNIVANLLVIPQLGAVGAALTTIATEATAMSIAGFVVWRALKIALPWRTLVQVVLLAAVTGVLVLALPTSWHVLARLCVLTAVYAGAVWLVGLVKQDSLSLLRSAPTIHT